ncbi:MAG TPA: PadR family transcriptional regulator [Thermoplasmata archaeon]|nr:PadR family transcriptional regulator [Thermoplasmata archaeon]
MMRKKRGLRNWVLMILKRAPRNGAEIMDDMEVMTQGWWRPSPGSVYPLLEEMVKEGSVRKRDDGRYELSAPVDSLWSWPVPGGRRTPADVIREISGLTAYLEDLTRADPDTLKAIQSELDSIAERLRHLRN